MRGEDPTKLNASNLMTHLFWHRVPIVAEMNKVQKLAKWTKNATSMKPPLSYEKWMEEDEARLEEAQPNVVDMAHTALGHMEALKKMELVLAVRAMMQEEFNQLVTARNEATVHDGRGDIWSHQRA